MTHRRSAQCDLDDNAFPIRVKLKIPPGGFGREIERVMVWLIEEAGLGGFAWHPAETLGGEDAVALHLRWARDLARFLEAFPLLELADATTSRGYTSPRHPGA